MSAVGIFFVLLGLCMIITALSPKGLLTIKNNFRYMFTRAGRAQAKRIRERKANPYMAAKMDRMKTERELERKDNDLSRASRRVMDTYNRLPEANRPVYDVRVALVALDKKYGINAVNNHIDNQSNCPCRANGCVKYPEYGMLMAEFKETHAALRRQKRAEEKRERAIMLAGIENDLRSVDDIITSLRTEREAIDETTKELRV